MSEDVIETSLSFNEIESIVSDLVAVHGPKTTRISQRLGLEGGAWLLDSESPDELLIFYGNRHIKTGKLSTCFFLVEVVMSEEEGRGIVEIATADARTVNGVMQTPDVHNEIRDGIVAEILRLDTAAQVLRDRHSDIR